MLGRCDQEASEWVYTINTKAFDRKAVGILKTSQGPGMILLGPDIVQPRQQVEGVSWRSLDITSETAHELHGRLCKQHSSKRFGQPASPIRSAHEGNSHSTVGRCASTRLSNRANVLAVI